MDKKPTVRQFAHFVLEQEGLLGWNVTDCPGGVGHCSRERKEIMLGENATYGVVLHEIAHALDENPPTLDGHWGHHADLMHMLFDKYGTIPDYDKYVHLD